MRTENKYIPQKVSGLDNSKHANSPEICEGGRIREMLLKSSDNVRIVCKFEAEK